MTEKILTEETPKEIEESKERKNYFNFFSRLIDRDSLTPGHLYKYSVFLEFENKNIPYHPGQLLIPGPPFLKRIKIDNEQIIEADREIELMRNR